MFLADAAATVQISPKPATMTIGESVTVTAQGFDAQGNPTPIQDPRWFYDTTRFTGSVDPQDPCKCTFTAIAPGSAGIMCSDGQPGTGPDDSHTVTIVSAGDLVRSDVTPDQANLKVGEQQQFTATGYDAWDNPVPITPTWTTTGGGAIDNTGNYTATTPGDFTVTASVTGSGVTGTAQVHVTAGDLVRSDVTPDQANLKVGEQQQFTATGYDAWGNPVPITPTWTTTGGTINPTTGLYTATVVGDFTVTASVVGSPITGTATVHVDPGPLARIDVTPAEVSLQIGNQQQFLATGRDAQGNPVPITPTWTTTGGTINPTTGLYTATTVGDFTVTATDPGTGIQGTATVHVTQAGPPARLILRPLAARTRPGGIVQFTATATDARGRPTPVTVTWTTTGGTITDDGLFTAGPRRGLVTVMARVPGTRLRAIALVMILWR